MRNRYPLSMVPFIRSISTCIRVCKKDIQQLGYQRAYEVFMNRSQGWIASKDGIAVSEPEEAIAIAAFAAALSFVNLLWATGEIDNAAK